MSVGRSGKNNNVKVLVVGSRNFNDYGLLRKSLDGLLAGKTGIEIVSGGARGADGLAERYAREKGCGLKVFPADWDRFGKSAGYKRNAEMHKYISGFEDRVCVAFWDGESRGTAHSFELARQYGNPLTVIRC